MLYLSLIVGSEYNHFRKTKEIDGNYATKHLNKYRNRVVVPIRNSYNCCMVKTQYTRQAVKGLAKMPRPQAKKMNQALIEIGNGRTAGKNIKPLHGREGYRLRRGDYRAIYQATENGIIVLRVGTRGDIYK